MNRISVDTLIEIVKSLPTNPGVYLMKDAQGTILYVGKASNLHHRVRSYFFDSNNLNPKNRRMMTRVADIDFFVTASEEEALVLELNLIKRYSPYYNVRLKDDKNFPYLKIDINEDFPRVQICRHLDNNGSRFFGPFASTKSIRQALKVVKDIFPFRPCSKNLKHLLSRPCLEYDLHNCSAPCIGTVTKEEYAQIIKQLILFLEGKQEMVINQLKGDMKQASTTLDYEEAAKIRDRIRAVKEVVKWQKMSTIVKGEQDVIAFCRDKDQTYVQVFFIRGNKLIGREGFTLQGTRSVDDKQIMTDFIKQFYNSCSYIPPLILVQFPIEDKGTIENWLTSKRGSSTRILVPSRGVKKQIIDIVAENAARGLQQLKIKQLSSPSKLQAAMEEIKKELNLPCLPLRMEGYDVSNIQGKAAVGSMVVFENGKPQTVSYRRFMIKTVPKADDYAMLYEIIRRRFSRFKKDSSSDNASWTVRPNLILIDGGRGQLNSVIEAMAEMGVKTIPVFSIAKESEQIFSPQQVQPITLPFTSPGLQLLQRLRDEAHRFAINYHRRLHKRQSLGSALDSIFGIGPWRKRNLLRQFGSVSAIKEAKIEEIAATKGLNLKIARRIKETL